MKHSRSKPKQKGCLWTVITFPFYLIYKEAMVITNNVFTSAAEALARENGVKLLSGVK